MRYLRLVGAPFLGAAGIAVAATHWSRPHGGEEGPVALLRQTLLAPEALPVLVVAFVLLALLWRYVVPAGARRAGIPGGIARRAVVPAVAGPGAAVAGAALDAVAFRCTVPALLGLGAGLGLTAAWATIARERRGPGEPVREAGETMTPGPAASGAGSSGPEVHAAAWPGPGAHAAAPAARPADRTAGSGGVLAPLLVGLLAVLPPLALLPGWTEAAGDEPHYLVVTHSLLEDGDLDVRDEYVDGAYRPFHPASLSPHYKAGVREGSRYSMHGVGMPVLLLPAYATAGALGTDRVALPRLLLVLLYGVFAVLLYGLIEDVAGRPAALAGALSTTLLAPLVFSPLYLFPEVPAMLLGCLAFRVARRPGAAGAGALVTAAVAVAALPWLGVKYIAMAAALVAGAWLCVRQDRGGVSRTAAAMTVALGLTLVAHGAWTWDLYGSLSPVSVYLGSAASGSPGPALGGDLMAYVRAWPGALATAVGYLADQKGGLLSYGPHFLLAAAGVPWLWRRRRGDLAFLGLVAAAHAAPYALSQQLGGQGPPVRPLMAVLWTLAAPLGLALALPVGRALAAARAALVALATSITSLLAVEPALLPHDYPVEASRLVRSLSPEGAGWWRAFPQWVNVETPTPWGTAGATGLLLAVAAWLLWLGWRSAADGGGPGGVPRSASTRRPATGPRPAVGQRSAVAPLAAALVLVACCGGVLAHRATVVVTGLHRPTSLSSGLTAWVEERLPERLWAEEEGIWVRPGRPMELVLTAPRDVERLAVRLRGLVDTRASVRIGGDRLAGPARPGSSLVGALEPGTGWPWRGGRAWLVRLEAERGAAPADLGSSRDERLLGAFLQVDAVVPAAPGPGAPRAGLTATPGSDPRVAPGDGPWTAPGEDHRTDPGGWR